jgi:mannose-6-phosphate isomerase-like protein (cupin superfamily)
MIRFCMMAMLALPLLWAAPQAGAPAGSEYWSNASIDQAVQKLDAKAATDPHRVGTQQLADYPNDAVLLAHREGDGQAEWHENQVDVIFVRSGSATLILGGTMANSETVAPHEKRSATIEGGTREKLSAGDVARIPARTPHQLLLDGSREFTYFVVKVKGY